MGLKLTLPTLYPPHLTPSQDFGEFDLLQIEANSEKVGTTKKLHTTGKFSKSIIVCNITI